MKQVNSAADTRRWWIVGCEGSVPHFYEAPVARSAVAKFRANLIDMERQCTGVSLRDAQYIVRGLGPRVLDGPLSTSEAFELDRGWAWAIASCDKFDRVMPTGPFDRASAVRHIGEDRVERLDRSARERYGLPGEACAA